MGFVGKDRAWRIAREWALKAEDALALKPKPNGGRKHENMTLAEEKASRVLLKRLGPARC